MDTKKIVNICTLTLPSVTRESTTTRVRIERVRVSLLVDVDEDTVCPWGIIPKRIFARRSPASASESEGVPREQALLPACYNNSTVVRAREALALSFVDKDLAP